MWEPCNHDCDTTDPELYEPHRSHFLDCPVWIDMMGSSIPTKTIGA